MDWVQTQKVEAHINCESTIAYGVRSITKGIAVDFSSNFTRLWICSHFGLVR